MKNYKIKLKTVCLRSCDQEGEDEMARPFTETGAGQLDVDLEALKHFFGEHSNKSLRRVFSRLSQVRVCLCRMTGVGTGVWLLHRAFLHLIAR